MINVQGLHNWVPDEQAKSCSVCSAAFGLITRRHHCRGCGRVACSKCLKKASIYSASVGPQLTCHQCYSEAASVLAPEARSSGENPVKDEAAPSNKKVSAATRPPAVKQEKSADPANHTVATTGATAATTDDDDGWDDPRSEGVQPQPASNNEADDDGWDSWEPKAEAPGGSAEPAPAGDDWD